MKTLPLPAAVLSQHIIALGKTGSGKSSKMRVLVEQLLDDGQPVCILDPKGDWWGIKSSADGKRAGYPVVIFGGEHADIPLSPHAGAEVAELVATGNRPALIDLGDWTIGERTRFFLDFAPSYFRHARGRRWLVKDEVHNFAPQGKILDPDAGKMLHWANRLASEGRGKGITIIAASQRPQKVHKDFLTSCETLIAGRVIHKLDRDAIRDWIDGCADPAKGRQVLQELATMKREEAWVWSPEIDFGPDRIRFPMFRTYDSFRPRDEHAPTLKGWAEVDLEEVRSKLSKLVAEAKANDPAALRRQIADLQRQLRARESGASAAELAARRRLGFEEGRASATAAIARKLESLTRAGDEFVGRLHALAQSIETSPGAAPENPEPQSRQMPAKQVDLLPRARPRRQTDGAAPADPEGLTGPERRILDAIAWLEALGINPCQQTAVAFLAGYTVGTGGFNNARSRLRVRGLVEYVPGERIRLTDAGRAVANPPPHALTEDELHQRVLARLPGPQQRLLRPLLEAYPNPMSNEELAAAANYTPGTGGFNNPRSRLHSLGLIEYIAGQNVAASCLFLGGH